jgi:hypothetical protein
MWMTTMEGMIRKMQSFIFPALDFQSKQHHFSTSRLCVISMSEHEL